MIYYVRVEDSRGDLLDESIEVYANPKAVQAMADVLLAQWPGIERQAIWWERRADAWYHVGTIAIYPRGASIHRVSSAPASVDFWKTHAQIAHAGGEQ